MLRIRAVDGRGRPLPGATLEVAHAAAAAREPGLRGAQVTDPHGYAEFKTVFPGWSATRTVAVEVALFLAGTVHVGVLAFPETVIAQVAGLPAYRGNPVAHSPAEPAGVLHVVPRDRFDLNTGLLATITTTIDR
ncbi:hypothetical protein [Actinoplanes sp. NPDC051851]|uniref:hypothetical protein n=1 Tax=Actinoplanes sp. NPDC051851 TaxID=3154753 RepID=UPI0034408A4A